MEWNVVEERTSLELNRLKERFIADVKGSMVEHIKDFKKFNIRVNDILEEHRIYVFIGNLKDNIQHEAHLWEPDHWRRHSRWK